MKRSFRCFLSVAKYNLRCVIASYPNWIKNKESKVICMRFLFLLTVRCPPFQSRALSELHSIRAPLLIL